MVNYKPLVTFLFSVWTILAHATDATFESNGVKIHYVTEGEGEPVVLIHGWMSDSTMWGRGGMGKTKLSPLAGFKLIALDCRGHGFSDKPHEERAYGVEMANDVLRLLDHLQIKKAHLVGYSMGAFIAGKLVATHPERVISVVYGGQAPLTPGLQSEGGNEVKIFAKAVSEGKGLGPYLQAVMPASPTKPTLEQANALAKIIYDKKDVQAYAAVGLSLGKLEVTVERLRKCSAPTLYIFGSKESDGLRERVAALRRRLGGELRIIEGADHLTTLANPEFGATIVKFLLTHRERA